MKKIYKNPEMEVLTIQTQQMLAASENIGFGTPVENADGADARELIEFEW